MPAKKNKNQATTAPAAAAPAAAPAAASYTAVGWGGAPDEELARLMAQAAALDLKTSVPYSAAPYTVPTYTAAPTAAAAGAGAAAAAAKPVKTIPPIVPRAKVYDADGWEVIADDRKASYDKRRAKKQAEAKQALLEKTDLLSDDAVAAALLKADRVAQQLHGGNAAFRIDAKGGKGPNQQSKKKKAVSQRLVISSEKQLIETVSSLVRNHPHSRGAMQVSAIGDRIQEMTGQPWSKKLKSTYGTLPEFLKKHTAQFHMTADQKVFIRADWDAIKSREDPLGANKKKKAAAPAAGAAAGASGGGKSKSRGDSAAAADANAPEDGMSGALRLFLILLLAIVVMIVVYMGVEKITFGELVSRITASAPAAGGRRK